MFFFGKFNNLNAYYSFLLLLFLKVLTTEKQEILELENYFVAASATKTTITESNSQLIGKVMKFDPTGAARRPPNEILQNVHKMNNEYKLGQLLCRCREPDYLLMLIKRQNANVSLSWLSGLIESNTDCLDIMPIQCICEFVWNMFNGSDEIALKVNYLFRSNVYV